MYMQLLCIQTGIEGERGECTSMAYIYIYIVMQKQKVFGLVALRRFCFGTALSWMTDNSSRAHLHVHAYMYAWRNEELTIGCRLSSSCKYCIFSVT